MDCSWITRNFSPKGTCYIYKFVNPWNKYRTTYVHKQSNCIDYILVDSSQYVERKHAESCNYRVSYAIQKTRRCLSLYILVHSKTRKKGLVYAFARKGLSVSYERVENIELSITKQLCSQYQRR